VKQKRIRVPKRGTPSATTQKIIDHLLRLADPERRDDSEVETTMLVMMRVQRPTVRRALGGDL
jgi:hypothetical protein